MYKYNCIIVRVIDGDTVVVDIDLGFDTWLKNQYVRLHGVNTPEVRTRDLFEKEKGLAAKEYVEKLLPVGSHRQLFSREYQRGKYGRIIGDFWIGDDVYDKEKNVKLDVIPPDETVFYMTGCTFLSELLLFDGYAELYEK